MCEMVCNDAIEKPFFVGHLLIVLGWDFSLRIPAKITTLRSTIGTLEKL